MMRDRPPAAGHSQQEEPSNCIPRGLSILSPIVIVTGAGAEVTDQQGRTYIDFAGGIGVNNVGHCAPPVVAAIREQAERLIHNCAHVALSEPYANLAFRLAAITPGDFPKKVMLINSGAEAVENAAKIARSFTGRAALVCFEGAFHGRTLLGMSLTGKTKPYKQGFGPFCGEVYRIPYPYCYRCPYDKTYPECRCHCTTALSQLFQAQVPAEDVAAVIVEPQLGEGGFVPAPAEFLQRLRQSCDEHGILLIVDEVQTGFGRTGKLFALEHSGVAPDLMLLAKSLGGGLPLGAVVGRAEIMDAPGVGGLGTTFGGNPIACQAALAVIKMMDRDFLVRARIVGNKLSEGFAMLQRRHSIIGDVRGLGAMVAMELVQDRRTKAPATEAARALIAACQKRGLIILSAGANGNVIRALPPLVITDAQLERALVILEETFAEMAGGMSI